MSIRGLLLLAGWISLMGASPLDGSKPTPAPRPNMLEKLGPDSGTCVSVANRCRSESVSRPVWSSSNCGIPAECASASSWSRQIHRFLCSTPAEAADSVGLVFAGRPRNWCKSKPRASPTASRSTFLPRGAGRGSASNQRDDASGACATSPGGLAHRLDDGRSYRGRRDYPAFGRAGFNGGRGAGACCRLSHQCPDD